MKNGAVARFLIAISVIGVLCMVNKISIAQEKKAGGSTLLSTEALFETKGEKKYGHYERFMDPVNEKRCMDYMKQWEVVTDYDGKPLPASDPYVKQMVEEREKYGVSARDIQNENQWYMKFMETEDWYSPFNLTMIREDGQIRYRYGTREQISDPEPGCSMRGTFYFYEPHEVRNMAAIMYTYYDPSRQSDYWIYLPSLRRFRRISAADRDDSFFGSDCTWADASDIKVDEEKHRMLREEPYPTKYAEAYNTFPYPDVWEYKNIEGYDQLNNTWFDGVQNVDRRKLPGKVFDEIVKMYPKIKKSPGDLFNGYDPVPESRGCPTYVIESIPQWKTYYAKKITWMKKAPRFSINQEYYDPKGRFIKYFLRGYTTYGKKPEGPYDQGWGIFHWWIKDLMTQHQSSHWPMQMLGNQGWRNERQRFTQPYVAGRGK
jgi:hypothetical protein